GGCTRRNVMPERGGTAASIWRTASMPPGGTPAPTTSTGGCTETVSPLSCTAIGLLPAPTRAPHGTLQRRPPARRQRGAAPANGTSLDSERHPAIVCAARHRRAGWRVGRRPRVAQLLQAQDAPRVRAVHLLEHVVGQVDAVDFPAALYRRREVVEVLVAGL